MKSIRLGLLLPFLSAAAFVAMAGPSRADTQAVEVSQYGNAQESSKTVGWQFSLDKPILVTFLGVYDYGSNGMGWDHTVTIWRNADKTSVVSAVVAATSETGSAWHWTALPTSELLAPGTYTISATNPSKYDYWLTNTTATMAPGITFEGNRSTWDPVMPEEIIDYWNDGLFGPNFKFRDPDPVPEPSLIQLPVLLGLGGLGVWWRRRTRS